MIRKQIKFMVLCLALASCAVDPKVKVTLIKKVTVKGIQPFRETSTLEEHNPKWKVDLSDGSSMTLRYCPQIGDTFEYRYLSDKK